MTGNGRQRQCHCDDHLPVKMELIDEAEAVSSLITIHNVMEVATDNAENINNDAMNDGTPSFDGEDVEIGANLTSEAK